MNEYFSSNSNIYIYLRDVVSEGWVFYWVELLSIIISIIYFYGSYLTIDKRQPAYLN